MIQSFLNRYPLLIGISSLAIIILLAFFLRERLFLKKEFSSVAERLAEKDSLSTRLTVKDEDSCFWIVPSSNGTHYFLEVSHYNYTQPGCYGKLFNTTKIMMERPANIVGDTDCFCSGYRFEIRKSVDGEFFEIMVKER